MSITRHVSMSIVAEWIESSKLEAPPEIAVELSKCSKLWRSIQLLDSTPETPSPAQPLALEDFRAHQAKYLLEDLNECVQGNESGHVFIGIRGELGAFNNVADRAVEFIKTASDIELAICTFGGCGVSAAKIVLALQEASIRGVRSVATVYHLALSAGAVVLQGASHRRMTADSHLMIHSPAIFCAGTANELRQKADEAERAAEQDIKLFCERTQLLEKTVRNWYDGKSHYFDAETAKRFNLVDEVIPPCGAPSRSDKAELL